VAHVLVVRVTAGIILQAAVDQVMRQFWGQVRRIRAPSRLPVLALHSVPSRLRPSPCPDPNDLISFQQTAPDLSQCAPLPLFCEVSASALCPSVIVIDIGTSGPPKKKCFVMCTIATITHLNVLNQSAVEPTSSGVAEVYSVRHQYICDPVSEPDPPPGGRESESLS
jgi:hypothetical protein